MARARDGGGQRRELREVVGEALAADECGVLVPRILHRDLGRVDRGGVPSAGGLRGGVVNSAGNDPGVVERPLELPARARLGGLSELARPWQTAPGWFKRRRCGPPRAGRRRRLLGERKGEPRERQLMCVHASTDGRAGLRRRSRASNPRPLRVSEG